MTPNHQIQDKRENQSTRTPMAVVKVLELALSICCTYLHYYSFSDRDVNIEFLATGTFCGYVIILTAIMAGYLMKAKMNKRILLFYSLLGSALFLTSGIYILESWERSWRNRTRDLAMIKGVVSIINGVIFFMDAVFTFRQKK